MESAATKFLANMTGSQAEVGLCRGFSDQVQDSLNSSFGGIGSAGGGDSGGPIAPQCSMPDELQEPGALSQFTTYLDKNGKFSPEKY
jgi:hypothetical protein